MKSFEQLAKAAYDAWHVSHGTNKHQVPFAHLDAAYRRHWVAVAQAVAKDVAAIH